MLRCIFIILMLTTGSLIAGDRPDPKDHEFNPDMPGQLHGIDQSLKTETGQDFNVYVSGPTDAPRGILLVHEWWGLNDHIRGWADRFAALGYRAVAVDLYDGRVTTDPKQAGEWMHSVDQPGADAKLRAALDFLKSKDRKLATIGWCFGGGQSLRASLIEPESVQATVIYYGHLVHEAEELKKLQGPVLGIFADRDTWITPDEVGKFKRAMALAHRPLEVHSYDADHAFANPSGDRYDSDAAKAAWQETEEFLRRVLK